MTYEEIFQEGRAVEREQCCKDVCFGCDRANYYGVAQREAKPGGSMHWWHGKIACQAYAIRERAWQQEK